MGTNDITYVHGAIGDLSAQVGTTAARLMEIHDDVLNKTQALQEFFEGEAGTAFNARQIQILKGLDGLIQVVMTHGSKIGESSELAHALDVNIGAGF
jgi:uncharacterized protein YukE